MTILKGPSDADHYRIRVGRYHDRWYTDPLPTCPIAEASEWQGPSFSIVKKASGSDWSFVSLGRAADDLAARPQAYTGIARDKIYGQFTTANKTGLNVAARRGTIIHWWFEDGLAGRPFRTVTDIDLAAARIPDESRTLALTYKDAVGAFFDTYQPELVVAEVVVIDRDLNGVGYGATGDAGVLIEGDLYAADWKSRGASSDHGAYPEEAAQVGGAFAGAQYVIVTGDDGNPVRASVPTFDAGLIVSVKPDGCRIYPVDIPKARQHWEAMHAWWCARRDERKAIGRSWPAKIAPVATDPPGSTVEQPAPESAPPAGSGAGTNAGADGLGGASRNEARRQSLLDRLDSFSDADKDDFVLGLVERNIDRADLDAVEALLDEVDAFNKPAAEAPPQTHKTAPAPRPQPPDEGADVGEADVEALKKCFDAMSPEAKAWAGALPVQSNAGHCWRINERATVRRYELYRGVFALAEWALGRRS